MKPPRNALLGSFHRRAPHACMQDRGAAVHLVWGFFLLGDNLAKGLADTRRITTCEQAAGRMTRSPPGFGKAPAKQK